ncbi:MAG: tryptophan synthase subunit alpha [Candidatus Hadarchaeum sp.]|uniref:tryptophan synthase subunit alpha n=1 Tax=Candidatus Hadarchaeum sp. TaxID=2883567 RepID=UPI003D0E139C
MDPLEAKFQELRDRREGAHMAHLYYGDPCEDFSLKLAETLVENGADIIELGIPFSDPTADGPVFQAACERALKAGVTPVRCIEAIAKLRKSGVKAPIVVTTYFNIPYVMGFEKFLDMVKAAGAQGLLIPDLPLEEAGPYLELAAERDLHLLLQVAPTTSKERLEHILRVATGFIYLISHEGVTGAKLKWPNSALKRIGDIKARSAVPVVVGFGISRREQVEIIMSAGADGVVVGSAYAKIYSQNLLNPFELLPEIARLVHEIKIGCKKVTPPFSRLNLKIRKMVEK